MQKEHRVPAQGVMEAATPEVGSRVQVLIDGYLETRDEATRQRVVEGMAPVVEAIARRYARTREAGGELAAGAVGAPSEGGGEAPRRAGPARNDRGAGRATEPARRGSGGASDQGHGARCPLAHRARRRRRRRGRDRSLEDPQPALC